MPSGAKKRKAAKKKKEMDSGFNSYSSTTPSHGDDDLKHHAEKESDSGEVSSPASQDFHSDQHPFREGEEKKLEKRDETSSAQSVVDRTIPISEANNDAENGLETAKEEANLVQGNRELKLHDESKSKNESSSSSSSGSSSDDEPNVVQKSSILVEPVVEVHENAQVDTSITSHAPDFDFKENQKKELASPGENSGVSPVVMDFGSKEKENLVISTSNEYAATSSDQKVSLTEKNEEKLFMSHNPPTVDTSFGAGHIKQSETSECSDSQPLVEPAPRPVQRTSWKSCCGLFEAFTSSDK